MAVPLIRRKQSNVSNTRTGKSRVLYMLSNSLLTEASAADLIWLSSLTLISSSFVACSSSFAASNSSLEACSSSLAACTSSLRACISSLEAAISSIRVCNCSRALSSSRRVSSLTAPVSAGFLPRWAPSSPFPSSNTTRNNWDSLASDTGRRPSRQVSPPQAAIRLRRL